MSGYISYRLAAALSRNLPGGFAYWIGLRISDLFYFFQRASRRAVTANLAQVYKSRRIEPSANVLRGLTRKTFQNFGKYLVDFFRYTQVHRDELQRIISIEQLERLEYAFGLGRGVIIVTAHFGNWELGGAMLYALGYPVNVVAAPAEMPRVQDLLQKSREGRGLRVVSVGYAGRALLRCLKKGEIVALLSDRNFSNERNTLELFGKTVRFPRGAGWLAARTGAPIVPVFLMRLPDDTFLLRIHEPIIPDAASDPMQLTGQIRDAIEKEVGERPCQWFVFHEFWKPEPGNKS